MHNSLSYRQLRITHYALRIGLFVLVLSQLLPHLPAAAPAPATVTPSPTPAAPISTNPLIGVHTRLTDEPGEENIRRSMAMVRAMGASWTVEYFPWVYVQPTDAAHFDWQHIDMVVQAAVDNGITLVARFDGTPGWARPADSTWKYLGPEHYGDYAAFVAAFANRYRGRVSHLIIWNEPNLSAEWGTRKPDPVAYTELLKVSYRAIKAANPEAVVLMAGLAPTLEPEDSPWGLRDTTFLERVYAAGGGEFFDALAAHAYGLLAAPDDPPGSDKLNFARVSLLHDLMAAHGDGAKEIYVTESGWNDSPRWAWGVKPYQRISYTIRAYQKAREEWPWCRMIAIWMFRLPKPAYTFFDNYTFVTPDFVPKPLYDEVRKYATGVGT